MDVHRAARIASAGHGAQTLLSGVTRDLVGTDLPDGAVLTDLGEHWLKDLAQPEHLYQLNVEGLPQAFAPLKSLVTLPNNLPRHLNTFVGRREDVAEVRQLTTESPLVTLTGPGGVGQDATLPAGGGRGARHVRRRRLAGRARDAPRRQPRAAADRGRAGRRRGVGRRLRLDPCSATSARARLLLILDNCEHLIDACAQLADSLLRACPGLRILATSREPLGVAGERTVPGSLAVRCRRARARPTAAALAEFEAVRLFVERAQAADPRSP